MKRIIFFSSFLCCFHLNAQDIDGFLKYSFKELDSLYGLQKKAEVQLPISLAMLKIAEKELDINDTLFAKVLYKVGNTYRKLMDWNNAFYYLEKSVNIWQKKMILNLGHANALNSLGIVCYNTGRDQETEKYWQQTMEIRKKILGDEHLDYAISLNSLGVLYNKLGDHKLAETYYINALKIKKNITGEDNPDYATSLNNLGLLYFNMGDYKAAVPYYIQSLDIIKKSNGEEHPFYAKILNNLGLLYRAMEDYESAEKTILKSIDIIKRVLGDEHPDYAQGLNSLGALYEAIKDYKSAEPVFKKVTEIKLALGEKDLVYLSSLQNLGNIYFFRKDYKTAETFYNQSLEIIKENIGEKSPYYTNSLQNHGMLYTKMGDYMLADQFFDNCFDIIKNNLSENFSWLSEKGKEAYWYQEKDLFKDINYFASKAKDSNNKAVSMAYNSNLISKGILLESFKEVEDAVINSNDSTTLQVYKELKKIKKIIIQSVTSSQGDDDSLIKFENEADSLDKILVNRLGEYAVSKRKFEFTWKDVQNTLENDEAAIEYTTFFNDKDSQNYYMALVLRKAFEYPKLVKLGSEKEIEDISAASGFSELYKLIWEPIDSLMDGVKTVYYSPTGYLNNISFSALCGKGSEEVVASTDNKRGNVTKNKTKTRDCVYLADRFTLHQLSTTRYLAEGLKESKLDNSILVFGGVNYDVIPNTKDSIVEAGSEDFALIENINRSSANQNKMEYLPGTKLESENLRKILSKKKWQVKAYSDVNASENNFKSELNNKTSSVLHIATHGFAFPEQEEKKKGKFEDNDRPYRDSDNPMARCGLLLAGANNSWLGNADTMLAKSGEDGILSALEVSQLNLRKTKLVVLSACETGLGKIEGSEGTFGLKRGFKLAGVEQIIVSLWSVPDKETMELMTLFYNDLSVTLNPVTSFEKAQKEMRKKYPTEPEKWAGFVLVR